MWYQSFIRTKECLLHPASTERNKVEKFSCARQSQAICHFICLKNAWKCTVLVLFLQLYFGSIVYCLLDTLGYRYSRYTYDTVYLYRVRGWWRQNRLSALWPLSFALQVFLDSLFVWLPWQQHYIVSRSKLTDDVNKKCLGESGC